MSKNAISKNLLKSLILHGRIKTTQAKAKKVKSVVDKVISRAKQGKTDPLVNKELVDEIAARFKDRGSGFTRIVKIGPRKGDNAPMVLLEFVEAKKV